MAGLRGSAAGDLRLVCAVRRSGGNHAEAATSPRLGLTPRHSTGSPLTRLPSSITTRPTAAEVGCVDPTWIIPIHQPSSPLLIIIRAGGPEVRLRGDPGELLIYLNGRQDAARVEVSGPGELTARLARVRLGT
jgi:hypothetical protein